MNTRELGETAIALKQQGLLIKQIAYKLDRGESRVREAMRIARRQPDMIASMWREGKDTAQIASALRETEAHVYNKFAEMRR